MLKLLVSPIAKTARSLTIRTRSPRALASPGVRLRPLVSDPRGMTVVEVLLAVFILSVGLIALASVMPLSTTHIQQSSLKTNAVFLAQERLEQVKNTRWTAIPVVDNLGGVGSNGSAAVATFPDDGYNTIAQYPFHRRSVRIRDCGIINGCGTPAVQDSNLRQVTVSVFFRPVMFNGGMNPDVEDGVQVSTLIARR
jgi:type II secretory pathway pseudopilin PulG